MLWEGAAGLLGLLIINCSVHGGGGEDTPTRDNCYMLFSSRKRALHLTALAVQPQHPSLIDPQRLSYVRGRTDLHMVLRHVCAPTNIHDSWRDRQAGRQAERERNNSEIMSRTKTSMTRNATQKVNTGE